MEVVIPSQGVDHRSLDFSFESACTSPCVSFPASPQRFGSSNYSFFSAPNSPTCSSTFFSEFNHHYALRETGTSSLPPPSPPTLEDNTNIAKLKDTTDAMEDGTNFAFNFNRQLDTPPLPADELFHCGMIKPRLQYHTNSPPSPNRKLQRASSPPQKATNFTSFAAAMHQNGTVHTQHRASIQRGKEAKLTSSKSCVPFSPLRVSDILSQREEAEQSSKSLISTSSSTWYKTWKLKRFLSQITLSNSQANGKDGNKCGSSARNSRVWGGKKLVLPLNRSPHGDVKTTSLSSIENGGRSFSVRRTGADTRKLNRKKRKGNIKAGPQAVQEIVDEHWNGLLLMD
ncbi:hypothetical protein RJ640_016522 [Escallonia rubra]|uniref:Uncharacterized protein n=1 Tax=Escallonia rubra TaxID=112253 RepID=A0AA88UVR5_9ASTE|nr:hypothetical protein RJ640_016522 [Escallonia rubra]